MLPCEGRLQAAACCLLEDGAEALDTKLAEAIAQRNEQVSILTFRKNLKIQCLHFDRQLLHPQSTTTTITKRSTSDLMYTAARPTISASTDAVLYAGVRKGIEVWRREWFILPKW